MYSLHLICNADEVDSLSGELWEHGTAGIRELGDGEIRTLISGFESNELRADLLRHFAGYHPHWEHEDAIDWVEQTQAAWPPREVGERIFLAPPWCNHPTPDGRIRIIHNPGLACGTGEHPCTQLALIALEEHVTPATRIADIGTGSGILAIAARKLGAREVVGTDLDETALGAARENFLLNDQTPALIVGSADCLQTESADITVANIGASVLLHILDHLVRITTRNGILILTGFPRWELSAFQTRFPDCHITVLNEWQCLTIKRSSAPA